MGMLRCNPWRITLFGALVLMPTLLWAQGDRVQAAWEAGLDLPWYWDNIEGGKAWLGGPKPGYRRGLKMHVVSLAPGEVLRVHLPAAHWLRLHAPEGGLDKSSLALGWSNTGALYAPLMAHIEDEGHTLYARLPESHAAGVLRLQRPADRAGSIQVAVFVSRQETPPPASVYRRRLDLPGQAVDIGVDARPGARRFQALSAGQPVALDIEGGDRLNIQARYAFDAQAPADEALFRIHVLLDGRPWRSLVFETRLDTYQRLSLEGCVSALGRLQQRYLDIPEGRHVLSLHSTARVYLRVLGRNAGDDLLFKANRPLNYESITNPVTTPDAIPGTDVLPRALREEDDVEQRARLAGQLARDNSRRAAALVAAALIRDAASTRAGAQSAALARSLLARHSAFRPLLAEGGGMQYSARFGRQGLRETGDRWFLPEGRLEALAAGLGRGYFQAARDSSRAARFRLPPRDADSALRIAVDRAGPPGDGVLMIQYDEAPAQRLYWQPRARLPGERLWPDRALAAVSLLEGRPHAYSPSPLADVEYVELGLPRQVQTVRLWYTGAGEAPAVALAYRAAQVFELSEQDYLARLYRLPAGRRYALLTAFLAGQQVAASPDTVQAHIEEDLMNAWQPLRRLLYPHAHRFARDTGLPAWREDISAARVRELRRQARSAERAGDALSALEHYAHLARSGDETVSGAALLDQARLLESLGEPRLAQAVLRSVVVHGNDAVARKAQEMLLQRYREAPVRALGLMAWLALNRPDPQNLNRLAGVLQAQGASREALEVALSLPEPDPELVARAAWRVRWWKSFDTVTAGMASARRDYWQGYRALARGDFETARAYWQSAGAEASLRRLREGLAIRAALAAKDARQRRDALRAWERWQGEGMDTGIWHTEPHHITAHAGGRMLYSPVRDRYSQRFRAEPGRAVNARVWGPARLRLVLRPVHGEDEDQALDDWLMVHDGDALRVHPVLNNRPTADLHIVGHADERPGRLEYAEFRLGPGLHELSFEPRRLPMLVGLQVQRPELPWSVLAHLDVQAVGQLLQGRAHRDEDVGNWSAIAAVSPQTCDGDAWRGRRPRFSDPASAIRTLNEFTGLQAAGRARIDGVDPEAGGSPPIPGDASVAGRDRAHVAQLTALLWRAGTATPRVRQALLVEAEAIQARDPTTPGSAPLMRRLREGSRWVLIEDIGYSAGKHLVDTPHLPSEHPFTRVREALRPPAIETEHRLAGDDRLVLALRNTQSARFRLVLRQRPLPYVRGESLRLGYRLNDGPTRYLRLAPDARTRYLPLRLGPGTHRLRLAIEAPVLDQQLGIRLQEYHAGQGWKPVYDPPQRAFEVATPKEPLEFSVWGPAWLRIDQFHAGGRVHTRYRHVRKGWQRLRLKPDPGRNTALYRVYLREIDPLHEARALRYASGEPAAPLAGWGLEAPVALEPVPIPERLVLGGHEDGSWGYEAAAVARRNFEEDQADTLGAERFMQLSATHRYRNRDGVLFTRSQALGRIRDAGGPTLGWRGALRYEPHHVPLDFDARASLYAQHPGGDTDTGAAAYLGGRVSQRRAITPRLWHRPALSGFVRYLSLKQAPGEEDRARVDQDIYTRYKDQHLNGLSLNDALFVRPRRDVLLRTGLGLMSNESLQGLDYTDLRFNARQWLGPWGLGAGLGARRYLDDEDRPDAYTRKLFTLEANWLQWRSPLRGLQGRVRLERDLDSGENAVYLGVSLNRARGRLYRDYHPSDMRFHDLSQGQALERVYVRGGRHD